MSLKSVNPWSITARLTFLSILSASIILSAIGGYLYQSLGDTFTQDNRQFLIKEIRLLKMVLQEQPVNLERLADEQSEGLDLSVGQYYSKILDGSGYRLIETPGMELLPKVIAFPVATEISAAKGTIQKISDGRTFMLMTVLDKTSPSYTIQIALDITHEAKLLAKYQRNLIGVLCLGLLFSTLAAMLVVRRGLSPLTDMTRYMEGITANQLHEQLNVADWPKELSIMAVAFNAMLLRLAKSFTQLNQFSADLSHELRTPINNLMGETEVALSKSRNADEYREILESNLEEYGRLSRIVKTLLFLARAENTEISLRKTRLDGKAELAAICSYHEAMAEEKSIQLVCQGQGFLNADAQLLKRVLSNLLLNAIQHTAIGGEVRLTLCSGDDGSVDICVQDNGYGITAEHLPKLFDRFYRVDPARSEEGTGLGLAIVKSIMDLHGGSVTVSSKIGKGTVVKLHFLAQ
ncbi:heavy metal sensor histidine kinase [Methylobacter sp. S3L5C]|uniref:heavy metal sensor histidine kinase n=1 Tax=Methylobacter sp. S3L5C TaxID=2839024 RepID=UPI001FABC6A1|nr:heavy metal sensor histidine kinase [Methylobacter sp. S3L5C]UOA07278.1 heavy metal sensor histidine kinase [Methylobacter sp. S3L5C]